MKKRENLINLIIVILVIVIICLLGYKLITKNKQEKYDYIKNIASISGTPTTVFIVDGVEKTTTNRLVGNVPKYRVIEHLKALGYINE